MANQNNFRFGALEEAITSDKVTELTNNYKADFFSEVANFSAIPKTSNYAVVISKKMWMELTDIFFNEHDFIQHDGVLINFGYDKTGPLANKNLSLIFQGFSTNKDANGDDVVLDELGRTMILLDNNSLTDAFQTNTGGGGANEGGTGASQIPPASPPRIL